MLDGSYNIVDLAILVSVFGLVLSLWLIGIFVWSRKRLSRLHHVQQRMGLEAQDGGETRVLRLWKDGQEATTIVPDRGRSSVLARLERLHREAGLEVPLQALLLGVSGMTTLVFLAALALAHSPLVGLGISVLLLLLFWAYLKGRINRRTVLLESQFVEALGLAARSLRAGHPLAGAFRLISEEMPAPVSTVFAEICQLQALGVSMKEAIHRVASTSSGSDLKLFATSVIIQLRSGGNLADMMNRLAFVIRDRMRLRRRVGVLTAQTQLSKRVMMVLPFVMFVVLTMLNPDYMAPLYLTRIGQYLLVIALTALLLGVWTMNRLSVLRY